MYLIATNYFEIILKEDNISIDNIEFISQEHLNELRGENPDAYFIRQKDKVYFWGNYDCEKKYTTLINTTEHSNIILRIIESIFLRQFYQNREKFIINKKLHVSKITILEEIDNGAFKGLKLYKNYSIHFTNTEILKSKKIGFTISTSVNGKLTLNRDDFEKLDIKSNDLNFSEKTNEVLTNSKSKYRVGAYYNYNSLLKNKLDQTNAIQIELDDINVFVKNYINNNIKSFVFPKSLEVIKIKQVEVPLLNKEGNLKNSILTLPERYYYKGRFPRSPNDFNNRKKIGFNKPFTFDQFDNNNIIIRVIVPKEFYNDVKNFTSFVKEELNVTYGIKLENIDISGKAVEGLHLKSYQKVLNAVGQADLVIIVVDERHESLPTNQSPYYFCKAEFIKRGINTQEVQIQQINKFLSDKRSKTPNYTDHNLALNVYAKLGGIAWTIKPNNPRNELIIGIGATTDNEGQPVLGITSVFRGDGKYLFGKVSSVTGMDDYYESLKEVLISTIKKSISDSILDTDQPFHLMFHIYKPAGRDNEIRALEEVVKQFSSYNFDYTFVHVGDGHNFRFFTFQNYEGKKVFEQKKGIGQNKRGTLVKVNDKIGFLCLSSSSSVFYKIDIHKKSSVIDLDYTANQLYQFAEMSHTSHNASSSPVTIKYPRLMAYFAQKFSELDGFYLDEITIPNNSLWFI